jgi:hypothetical protein
MSKDWRTVFRFANVGLAIAAIFFVFSRADHLTESWAGAWMFWASLPLCPGLFVFNVLKAGSELPVPDTALMWLVIAFCNYLFYAILGLIYVDLRERRGEPRPRIWFAKK